jgi:hypothetical protein
VRSGIAAFSADASPSDSATVSGTLITRKTAMFRNDRSTAGSVNTAA